MAEKSSSELKFDKLDRKLAKINKKFDSLHQKLDDIDRSFKMGIIFLSIEIIVIDIIITLSIAR